MSVVRRGDVADQVVEDGESVVLVGRDVVRLSTLATVVVGLVDDATPVEDVRAGVEAALGAPPTGVDGTAVVDAAIDELVRQGVLRRG